MIHSRLGSRTSRRVFLGALTVTSANAILAACSSASPTPTAPAATVAPTAAATKAPTTAPTTALAASPTAAAAAATTAPAPTAAPTSPVAAPATITVTTGGQFEFDRLFFQEWQKRTNIKVTWQLFPTSSHQEKVQTLLATGSAPDVFIASRLSIPKLGPGSSRPLDDLLKDNAPNFSQLLADHKDQVPDIRSANGKLYGLFGRNDWSYFGWIYRADLVKKLGISKLETLDDWTNFMKAAKKDNPNTFGVGKAFANVTTIARAIAGAFGIHGQLVDWLIMRDGKIIDASLLPEAKDAVSQVRSWYADGLVNPDHLANVIGPKHREALRSGKIVVDIDDYLDYMQPEQVKGKKLNPDFELQAAPPPTGPSGERAELDNYTGWSYWGAGIGLKAAKPEVGVRFIDYLLGDEGNLLFWLGVEGVTYEKSGDSYQFTAKVKDDVANALKKGIQDVNSPIVALGYTYGLGGAWGFMPRKNDPAPGKMRDAYVGVIEEKKQVDAENMERQYMSKLVPTPVFTEQEAGDLKTMVTDINTYRQETWTNMISGKASMNQWDTFVAQMKKLGIDKVVEIYNTAYQRTYQG